MALAIPFFLESSPNIHLPDYLHVTHHGLLNPELRAAEGEPIEEERSRMGSGAKELFWGGWVLSWVSGLVTKSTIRVRSSTNQSRNHERARKSRSKRSAAAGQKAKAVPAHGSRRQAKSMEKGESKGMIDVKLRMQK